MHKDHTLHTFASELSIDAQNAWKLLQDLLFLKIPRPGDSEQKSD